MKKIVKIDVKILPFHHIITIDFLSLKNHLKTIKNNIIFF